MTMFSKLDTSGVEESEDRVGGGFAPFESDVYDAEIKMAYAIEAASGAKGVTLIAEIDGRELRQTVYVTDRDGNPFYLDKSDKKTKHPLPGFTLVNDLCLFATEMELTDENQPIEEKAVKVYDFASKKEVVKPMPVLTGLIGKKVQLAVLKVIEDKMKKDDGGKYTIPDGTRIVNDIDKVMHPETGRTIPEYRNEVDPGVFKPTWLERNKGRDRDKSTKTQGASAGASGFGRPGAAGGAAGSSPKKKLFG